MARKLSRTGRSLGELLVAENTKKILDDSSSYFSPETSADIFEVHAGVGSFRAGLDNEDYLGALKVRLDPLYRLVLNPNEVPANLWGILGRSK